MEYIKRDFALLRQHQLAKQKRAFVTKKRQTEFIVPNADTSSRRAPKMEVSIRSVNAFIMVLLFSVATASPTDRACEEPTTSELSSLLTSNIHETFDLARFSHIPATHDILNFRHINRSFLTGQTGCRNSRMSSDISEASSCPWHYELNYDENRRPETIVEAKCNCRHHRPCIGGMENTHCEPVKYNIRVLRKYGCENGKFLYKQTMEKITVGCTCVVRN